jgi:dTMP kinase
VICDRFVDSSLAYQGVGSGVGFEEVYMINRFAIDDHMPDLTVYLDLTAQAGLDRIAGRKFLDRLDQEKINFHELVVEGYQEVKRRFKDRIVVVKADQEIETVQKEAFEAVLKKVKAYV